MKLGREVRVVPGPGAQVCVQVKDGEEVTGVLRGAWLSLHTGGRCVVIVDRGDEAVPIYTERIRAIKRID